MEAPGFSKTPTISSGAPKLDESSAFTKFLKENAEAGSLARFSRLDAADQQQHRDSSPAKFSKDHKSPFCIESLLKSESRTATDLPSSRLPLNSPDASPPPPGPTAFPAAPLPQFPFPPQLLPYLLPSAAAQSPDYMQMDYLARQGVFLNSFPAFAGRNKPFYK